MFHLSSILLFALAIATNSLASPTTPPPVVLGTPSTSGIHSGFYYSWNKFGAGNATYTNLADGGYSLAWSGPDINFIGGKGWMRGNNTRSVHPYVGIVETQS